MPNRCPYEDEDERRARVLAVREAIAAGGYVVDLDALAARLVLVEKEWLRCATARRPRGWRGR